jgi:uncharacterized protein YciI
MEHKPEITNETIREIVAQGQQYCVRIFKAGTVRNQPPAEAEQIQMEHLRYLFQLKAEGKMLINGPVMDDPEIKGMSIFNTTDKEEVKRLSDRDPAVIAGRLRYEIYLWFGKPGDCLPNS